MYRAAIVSIALFGLVGCQTPTIPAEVPAAAPPPSEQFIQSINSGDTAAARQLLDAHPDLLIDPRLLIRSIQRGQNEIAILLIERGANFSAAVRGEYQPIHAAVSKNQIEIARMLLERGADPNARPSNNETPLYTAAMWGYEEMTLLLLEHNADPNMRTRDGRTPLMMAGNGRPSKAWDILLAHGADPNLKDDAGATAADIASARDIALAIHNDDLPMLKKALADNPRTLQMRDVQGFSKNSAETAIRFGRTEMVAAMIGSGLDANQADANKVTLLHIAAESGRAEIARLLIDAGARADARDSEGRTPLQYTANTVARRRNSPEPDAPNTRRVLLAAGADVNARDENGRSAAFVSDPQAIREFVKRGGNINIIDTYNFTPVRAAAVNGQWELVTALLESGAKGDIITYCALGDLEQVKQLLDAEPKLLDLRWENPEKNHVDLTPLVIACKYDRREVAKFLIERGAQVNRGFPAWGWTPLHQAVEHDDVELARILLERGANPNMDDGSGLKLVDRAKSEPMRQLIESRSRT